MGKLVQRQIQGGRVQQRAGGRGQIDGINTPGWKWLPEMPEARHVVERTTAVARLNALDRERMHKNLVSQSQCHWRRISRCDQILGNCRGVASYQEEETCGEMKWTHVGRETEGHVRATWRRPLGSAPGPARARKSPEQLGRDAIRTIDRLLCLVCEQLDQRDAGVVHVLIGPTGGESRSAGDPFLNQVCPGALIQLRKWQRHVCTRPFGGGRERRTHGVGRRYLNGDVIGDGHEAGWDREAVAGGAPAWSSSIAVTRLTPGTPAIVRAS